MKKILDRVEYECEAIQPDTFQNLDPAIKIVKHDLLSNFSILNDTLT